MIIASASRPVRTTSPVPTHIPRSSVRRRPPAGGAHVMRHKARLIFHQFNPGLLVVVLLLLCWLGQLWIGYPADHQQFVMGWLLLAALRPAPGRARLARRPGGGSAGAA